MSNNGQDPVETAVPWSIFREKNITVTFATANGEVAKADERLTDRAGLLRKTMGGSEADLDKYEAMTKDHSFLTPKSWESPDFDILQYDGLLLPGGHDKPIKAYLESESLHKLVAKYFPHTSHTTGNKREEKVVAAICHGVLVLANSKNNGKSVIHDAKTTCLTGTLENMAYQATRLFMGDYYLTYGVDGKNTEQQVKEVLDKPEEQYVPGSVMTGSYVFPFLAPCCFLCTFF